MKEFNVGDCVVFNMNGHESVKEYHGMKAVVIRSAETHSVIESIDGHKFYTNNDFLDLECDIKDIQDNEIMGLIGE